MNIQKWTKKEINFLKKNVNEPYEFLQKLLPGRTLEAIIGKKDKLKLRRRSSLFWTNEQDAYLIKNYPKMTTNELKINLNKTGGSIFARINRLKQKGFKIKDRKPFLSSYWKKRYKTDKNLIKNHKSSVNKLWSNQEFREKHRNAMRDLFKNEKFYNKHRELFIKRRNSEKFRIKQSKAASKFLKTIHNNPKRAFVKSKKKPFQPTIICC